MKYFIYAYPAMYGGLHGMYNYDVVDCDDVEQALTIGLDMAREVIESYGFEEEIYTEEDYREENEVPEDHDIDWDDFYCVRDDVIAEELGVEIFLLNDDADEDEVLHCNLDPRDIIEEYCKEIDF